jgi:hypothetical protein
LKRLPQCKQAPIYPGISFFNYYFNNFSTFIEIYMHPVSPLGLLKCKRLQQFIVL